MLGQCLARLPESEGTRKQRLDVWLKGPVYYDSEVSLRTSGGPRDWVIALFADKEERPTIIARWSEADADSLLIDLHGGSPIVVTSDKSIVL